MMINKKKKAYAFSIENSGILAKKAGRFLDHPFYIFFFFFSL